MRTDWVLLCLQIQTEPFNELIPISALRRGSRQTVDACHPLKILERIERFQGMVGRGDVLSRPPGSFEGEVERRVVHSGIWKECRWWLEGCFPLGRAFCIDPSKGGLGQQ